MKKHLSLLYLFLFTIILKAQIGVTFQDIQKKSNFLQIKEDKYFTIYSSHPSNIDSDIIVMDIKMEGIVEKKENMYYLHIPKYSITYSIKIISEDKVLNINVPHLLKDTLYLSSRNSINSTIFGTWKDRKKDGTWTYINKIPGEKNKQEMYNKGKLLEIKYY